ncbi:hypothetical protein ABBQ32_007830 [Trebouxia sp. C0010 RCD-2024]
MESYTRLADGGRSQDTQPAFTPPFSSEYDQRRSITAMLRNWWTEHIRGTPAKQYPVSGYLTLIPLSDERLKPRRTKLLVGGLMLFAILAAVGVYLLVPRGISVGEIQLQSDHMSWNTTRGTYQLKLLAKIPIYNPNYVKAHIKGSLKLLFYDTEAGQTEIQQVFARPRALASNPYMLELVVDASNVPSKYILTILSECATFPRRLIFFVKGNFGAQFMGQTQSLPPIDTYFMIDCINGGSVPPAAHRPCYMNDNELKTITDTVPPVIL